MLKYIELKTGYTDNGPAWIARVKTSKSGRTLYFNGRALKQGGRGASGNHVDLTTGEMFWVSGVKRDGTDRRQAVSASPAAHCQSASECAAQRLKPKFVRRSTTSVGRFEVESHSRISRRAAARTL
jgi:hypothetical protein